METADAMPEKTLMTMETKSPTSVIHVPVE